MLHAYTTSPLKNRVPALLFAALLGMGAQATSYYVSANGNDANSGTSQASPWRTIDRLNQVTWQIQPGDQILFERGGTYRGEIIWGVSGTAASPVTIGAYGSGARPIISGSQLVTGWSQFQGNIWRAQVGQQVDQVFVNGARMTIARFPNSGWLRNDQGSGNTLHCSALNQAGGYWNGARAILRCTASSIDTLRVSNFSNGTVTFTSNPTNSNMGGDDWGFFFENRLSELDVPGEWFYEASSGYLYLQAPGNANPSSLTVEASVYWSGVNCYWQRHYLTVQDLQFRHQRNAGIRQDGADHVTVSNCKFEDVYHGIRSYGSYDNYTNNTFRRTYATAALIIDDHTTFASNTLNNIATVPGGGETSWGYMGIRSLGAGNIIRANVFDTVGYAAIEAGDDALIEKNVVKHHLATMNDGGAIQFDHTDGLIVQDNIVMDPICGLDGSSTVLPHYQRLGVGIYFGNTSNMNVICRRNTVARIPGAGINVDHNMNAVGYQIKNNVLFDNAVGMSISDYSNSNGPNAVYPYYVANYNDVYDGNVIYGLHKDQICVRFYNCYSAQPTDFGTFTNNRYFNPYNELSIFLFSFQAGQRYFSLERWQAERGEEAGSSRSPLRLEEQATIAELSANLVPGGAFPNNVTGWTAWPNNAQITHDMTQLDNGCLKAYIPDNSVYPTLSLRNPDWFSVEDQQWYRLDLSMKSNVNGQVIIGLKGQSQQSNPYTICERQIPFSTERRDLHLYFQATMSDQAQLLLVSQYTDPTYYLDNVQLHKVSVQQLDPNEDHIILVNDQSAPQDFPLTGCWSDVNGQDYSGSIEVAAYRSTVLFRQDDSVCGMSTAVQSAVQQPTRSLIAPNPARAGQWVSVNERLSGAVTFLGMNGQIAATVAVPSGSQGFELPGTLAKGVYAMHASGANGPVVTRIIVD